MSIDYQLLVDEAMLGIVKTILRSTAENGLTGEQSFYISFKTDAPEVVLSSSIKRKYPKEITIVLQYQFKDLIVFEDNFTVNLAFGGRSETIIVPFSALTSFIDPIANFSLQFNRKEDIMDFESDVFSFDLENKSEIMQMKPKSSTAQITSSKDKLPKKGKVIAIDKFRKKGK